MSIDDMSCYGARHVMTANIAQFGLAEKYASAMWISYMRNDLPVTGRLTDLQALIEFSYCDQMVTLFTEYLNNYFTN